MFILIDNVDIKRLFDLHLIYHQKDENTLAHLRLGLLTYRLESAVCRQFKQEGIRFRWHENVRTMNTKGYDHFGLKQQQWGDYDTLLFQANQLMRRLLDAPKYK